MSICVFHGLYILFFQLIMFHLFWTSFLYIYMYVLIWFIYTYLSHIYIYLFCAVSFALSKMFILKLFRRKIWCNENKYKWIQCSSIYVSRNYISLERIFFVKGKHFFFVSMNTLVAAVVLLNYYCRQYPLLCFSTRYYRHNKWFSIRMPFLPAIAQFQNGSGM